MGDSGLRGEHLRQLREVAHELADLADGVTLPAFREQAFDVERKRDGTPVTALDRGAERAMRSRINARFPDHAVLGEEDGLEGEPDAPRWILDPIDGTANFVSGTPVWATLIALQVAGVEQVAVISAPALGSRWDAIQGGPARQDGREIRVSATSSLVDASVSFGGLNHFHRHRLGAAVERLSLATKRQRGFGDFWQHCLVASGAVDVALEAIVSPWDLAAVRCLVTAAGGRMTDLSGADRIDGGNAVTSNGTLHDDVLAVVADLV